MADGGPADAGPRVGIVGVSRSDFPVSQKAKALLDELGVARLAEYRTAQTAGVLGDESSAEPLP